MHQVNKCYLVHENKHNATLDYIYIQPSKIKVGNGNAHLNADLFPYLHGNIIAEQMISNWSMLFM